MARMMSLFSTLLFPLVIFLVVICCCGAWSCKFNSSVVMFFLSIVLFSTITLLLLQERGTLSIYSVMGLLCFRQSRWWRESESPALKLQGCVMSKIGQRLMKKESEKREKKSRGNFILVYVISCLQIAWDAFLALITVHLFLIPISILYC